ncbi:hypothetical protein [Kaarinaea lacus]
MNSGSQNSGSQNIGSLNYGSLSHGFPKPRPMRRVYCRLVVSLNACIHQPGTLLAQIVRNLAVVQILLNFTKR